MRGNMGGKLFAVIVIVIALASAVPIITHTFMGASVQLPEDISTHGAEIDKQLDETMIEAGLSFLAAQLVLGFFVWQFGGRKNGPLKNFPGRSQVPGDRRCAARRRGSDCSGSARNQGVGEGLF